MGLRSYPLHCCKRRNRSHFAYRLDVETMRVLCQAIPYGSASHYGGSLPTSLRDTRSTGSHTYATSSHQQRSAPCLPFKRSGVQRIAAPLRHPGIESTILSPPLLGGLLQTRTSLLPTRDRIPKKGRSRLAPTRSASHFPIASQGRSRTNPVRRVPDEF